VAVRAAKQRRTLRSLTADLPGREVTVPEAELRTLLDAEIDRLPDRLRLPVVLCYLDERTTEDAARELGIPRGTVLSRLAAARQKLAGPPGSGGTTGGGEGAEGAQARMNKAGRPRGRCQTP
jgi:RNA polymerase sigma factor (sigma-70 family)